jgi:hypothetical protein
MDRTDSKGTKKKERYRIVTHVPVGEEKTWQVGQPEDTRVHYNGENDPHDG